jgi:hypothetical protein
MGNNMSMDWFQVTFAGNPHIKWEHLWFPVNIPLNQSNHSPISHIPFLVDLPPENTLLKTRFLMLGIC